MESLKIVLINMFTIFMMSAKLATPTQMYWGGFRAALHTKINGEYIAIKGWLKRRFGGLYA